MLPTDDNLDYPKFIANQVLQSKHLNDMFDYLDEQNRLTRTNLIGIGVVCGMDVVPIGANQIKISKGVGVTSAGYLISVPEKTYQSRKDYTVPSEIEYLTFYDKPNKVNRFQMWELIEGIPSGATTLTSQFLTGNGNEDDRKVILIFIELLYSNNHNCSPNSCDDKGANVKITFRPLLMRKADATILLNEAKAFDAGSVFVPNASVLLPDMKIKRFNVPQTSLTFAQDIIDAYRNILTRSFIETIVKTNWTNTFNLFSPILAPLNNAFATWNPTFGADNKIQLTNAYEYQYYYDFIADLIETYEELQEETGGMLAICNPDERLFPRHLFLGLANENTENVRSDFRHYFIPSPILGNKNLIKARIVSFFKKAMKLLSFAVPVPPKATLITPSKLGDFLLSDKAIPYYYDVLGSSEPLFTLWNYKKTQQNKAKQNLSYYAIDYPNPKPDFVIKPLEYDLEPYNFLRIEGYIGKNYKDALYEITTLRNTNRLPFDVVAIRTGEFTKKSDEVLNYDCHFQDLEINYDVARREWECCIGMMIEYLDDVLPIIDILTVRKNRLKNFVKKLVKAKKFLVDALPEFVKKWSLFIIDYEAIEQEAKDIRALLSGDLINAANDRKTVEDEISVEDLIDHLDSVIQSCQKGPFRAIYQEYMRRLGLVKEQFLLKNYANAHVGLQHKAGVPMGGTFILVYDDDPKTKSTVFADFYLPYLCCSDCSPSQVIIEKTEPLEPVATPLIAFVAGEPKCDATKQNYTVQIVVIGGKPKYKANGIEFEGNIRIESVPSGQSRNIEISDADNQKTMVSIGEFICPSPPPQPLTISVSEPKCDDKNKYNVEINISGGTPPYSHNGNTVSASFQLTFDSGINDFVQIQDSEGTFSNVIPIKPHFCCPYPCDGKLLNCEYPFFPILDDRFKVDVIFDTFEFSGTDFSMSFKNYNETLNEMLFTDTFWGDIVSLRRDFANKVNEIIDKITLPNKNLITFISDDSQKKELIRIASYQCNDFEIVFRLVINKETTITYTYTEKGLTINNENGAIFIEKGNCIVENLCDKNAEPESKCKGDLVIEAIKEERISTTDSNTIIRFATNIQTPGAKFVWTFATDDGSTPVPVSSTQQRPDIIFEKSVKEVKVKVFVVLGGCLDVFETIIVISRQ